jgi:hypothetical protein
MEPSARRTLCWRGTLSLGRAAENLPLYSLTEPLSTWPGRPPETRPGLAQAQYKNVSIVAGKLGRKEEGVLRASVARSVRSTRAFGVRATFFGGGKGTGEASTAAILAQGGPRQAQALCRSNTRARARSAHFGRRSCGSAGSRARSAWACSRGSNACARSSSARSGELRVGGGAVSRGLGGSRARSARACSLRNNACARSSGARSVNQASAEALAAKVLAAPELVLAGAVPVQSAVARVWGVKLRRRGQGMLAAKRQWRWGWFQGGGGGKVNTSCLRRHPTPSLSRGSNGIRAEATRFSGATAKALAAPERARRGCAPTKAAPALAAAARVLGSTRRRHRPPRPWRLPSAIGVGLFSREQCLRSQQRRAFGDIRIGGGTGLQSICSSRARSAWAYYHESSACTRNSGARFGL